jgi:hypothetical protein
MQASIFCLLVQFPHGNSLSHLSLSVVSFLSFVLLLTEREHTFADDKADMKVVGDCALL